MRAVIQTKPYVVSRLRLAYIAAEEYFRTFWFFVIAIPIGGIALLVLADPTLRAIGLFAILWPMTIPARSIIISTKASRLFASGVVMRAGDEEIEFLGTKPGKNGKPLRMAIPRSIIRDTVYRQRMLLIRTYRLAFIPVDPEAFEDEAARVEFENALSRD
jgi:hypothetical protein